MAKTSAIAEVAANSTASAATAGGVVGIPLWRRVLCAGAPPLERTTSDYGCVKDQRIEV